MTKIIDMAQNYTSTKCTKINEQLDLEDIQNINLCNVELTETNHNTINDNRITKTVIQSQFVKLLRQKVIKWLHIHQTLIQLNKYKLKQFNKDHYNYGDETEVTMNNTDEMIWKDDRVLACESRQYRGSRHKMHKCPQENDHLQALTTMGRYNQIMPSEFKLHPVSQAGGYQDSVRNVMASEVNDTK
ncbi:unnamed protein product [Schistosoma curassoni]|uniref:Uncharacterized protein n=1 Tax=Schistosoma curassoni TaxID=6186 RepID=A0A183KEP4_9TREM|nr:unnamed protein product [Schistosoma curassoni]